MTAFIAIAPVFLSAMDTEVVRLGRTPSFFIQIKSFSTTVKCFALVSEGKRAFVSLGGKTMFWSLLNIVLSCKK